MLNKKQLEDVIRCNDISCIDCSFFSDGCDEEKLMVEAVKTAFAYMEILEKLIENRYEPDKIHIYIDQAVKLLKEVGE